MKGMTWNHARGIDPLIAASAQWHAITGQTIAWDGRSLQDFESWPLDDLARHYDLLVIDHPHVGLVAEQGILLPFEQPIDDLVQGSIGGSLQSYVWQGQQWALPIDAAAQVMAWSPALLDAPPASFDALLALARAGHVAIPLRAPHALMSLMTLCGLCCVALDAVAPRLFPPEAAIAWECLRALWDACGAPGDAHDPIAVFEAMAAPDSAIAVAPLIYGYVSYARADFRPRRLRFADLVPVVGRLPRGSVLGGTGVAVSAFSPHREQAARFARWLAGAIAQRDVVAAHGGQPAHAAAWDDPRVNLETGDFYRATRATLDHAWVRPRHAAYIARQNTASCAIVAALAAGLPASNLFNRLNDILEQPS